MIDAYLFLVRPVMLGYGQPLLGGVIHNARLTLVEATPAAASSSPTRHAPDDIMLILSVKPGHDGGVAAIGDGELLFSLEAEKGSRRRHAVVGIS